jgi:CMP-N,N'-diacetyllegionaminic acid synthase
MSKDNLVPNIACIIPARGGSKGLPNKNILNFCGQPLISWSITQALATPSINCGVYVSSDAKEILNISESYGASPIQRPDTLATDTATSESALIHACDYISSLHKLDAVVFLQATSPLRASDDIQNGMDTFFSNQYDALFSSTELEDFFIWTNKKQGLQSFNYDYKNRKRRQDVTSQYVENGSFYIYKPELMAKHNNRLCGKIGQYIMKPWSIHEIDNSDDLDLCEFLFKKNKLNERN